MPPVYVGLLRIGLAAVIVAGAHVDRATRLDSRMFHVTAAVVFAYAIAALAPALASRWRPWMWRATAVIDLFALAVLTYASGGPYSEIRLAFILVPITTALLARRRHVLWTLVLSLAAYAGACFMFAATHDDVLLRHAIVETAGAGVRTILVGVLATILVGRTRRATTMAEQSQRLVAELQTAEERERKRLAVRLHDAPLQNLYSALSALRRNDEENSDARELTEGLLEGTIEQLRGVLTELHPPTLDHAGLGPALVALADERRARMPAAITVDAQAKSAGPWDELLFAAARELLTNIEKHAEASEAKITLRDLPEGYLLVVEDDGCGLDGTRLQQARRTGHIGLAALAERLLAVGGRLDIRSSESGTRAEVEVPARRQRDSSLPASRAVPWRVRDAADPEPARPGRRRHDAPELAQAGHQALAVRLQKQ